MLINSLKAKNFRKYNKLEVTDIPSSGVITVAGHNESGKTSIGEAICFALFGRTFSLEKKNLQKVICWGRDVAEVTLDFTDGAGEQYSLYRSYSRDGVSKVALTRGASSKDGDDQSIKLDEEGSVAETLSKILGFNYDAFANSFYLAQRELTTPDPKSDTIKQMAGIGEYGRITDELNAANEEQQQRIVEITPEAETTQAGLDEINLDEDWLPELIDAEETLGTEQQRREALVGQLNGNEQRYSANANQFHSAQKRRGLFGFLSMLAFPIMLISGILILLQQFLPDTLNQLLTTLSAQELFPKLSGWLVPTVIISGLLYLMSFFIKRSAKAEVSHLIGEANEIGVSLSNGHDQITTQVETLLPERIVQMLHGQDTEKKTLLRIPPREQFSNLVQLVDDAKTYDADSEELTAAVTRLSDALKKQDSDIVELGEGLLLDIDKEKTRSDKAGKLRAALKVLTSALNKCERNIGVQNISKGMLQRAAKDSVELFNKNIADISANTLPKFTEGRYSEVRIGEDLSVQVYSDEKKGYMDFDEISSGTQRQIMLALRMAMSEELSKNSGNEQQFIFLDEPFAFFDQSRTMSTLEALPDVSKVITQVWIVAQEFPAGVKVDKAINCPSDSAELLV